ncbi:MAG: hypothetical protein P8Y05_07705 [Deinococcales bacterium]
MRSTLRLGFVVFLVAGLAACSQIAPKAPTAPNAKPQATQASSGTVLHIQPTGTATFQPAPQGTVSKVRSQELAPTNMESSLGKAAVQQLHQQGVSAPGRGGIVTNRIPKKQQVNITPPGPSGGTTVAPFSTVSSFQGLDHYDQRTADNGHQFSVEPPDQGLCVGNGFALEALNDVVQVYDASSHQGKGVASLNQFFGYPSAIVRGSNGSPNVFGPSLTDPSCHYDAATGRWFLVVLTLQTDSSSGHLTGNNYLDIAVSNSNDPTGTWTTYRLDVTNDGASSYNLGDYPHFAVGANGVYITTDSFPFFTAGYNGAWVYALSKSQLEAGGTVNVFKTPMVDSQGLVGYSVAPAIPVGGGTPTTNGTEYFMSGTTVYQSSGHAVDVWALDGTRTLDSTTPALSLSSTRVPVGAYGDPPPVVRQPKGSAPLAQAFNANLFGYGKPPHHQQENGIATNDSGMKQTVFVNGHLWAALTTITQAAPAGGHSQGATQAGVAWYEISPSMSSSGTVSASLVKSGVVAPTNASLIFPAITMNANGKGVIAATLVGNRIYPSAAYVPITPAGTGSLTVAHAGAGPQDGFSEYFLGGDRPRWGDYGAAAVDGSGNLWISSEDIHQTCSYADYLNTGGTCGNTRSALANWSTQITEITP